MELGAEIGGKAMSVAMELGLAKRNSLSWRTLEKRFFIVETYKKHYPWLADAGMSLLLGKMLPQKDIISDSKRKWETKAECARVILKLVDEYLA